MVASTSQAFNHRKYLTDKGSMQDSNSPGCYMLVRAKNFVCVAGQALWWGLCEHSFLHRTMCLAKSCCRICGVSNLSHKLVLCLQFTVHTAMCPDTPGRVCTEWPIQPWCHCAEDYQLPNKQMKVKGTRQYHGRGFTDVCRAHTAVTGCIWLHIFLISS